MDDQDNGEAKQTLEDEVAEYELHDRAAAINQDADRIQADLENNSMESNQHPIRIRGVDLCQIAEKLDLMMSVESVLSKLTKEQSDTIYDKAEKDETENSGEPPAKKRRTKSRKHQLIFQYVKNNCNCIP